MLKSHGVTQMDVRSGYILSPVTQQGVYVQGRLLDVQSLDQLLQGEPWWILFLWHCIVALLKLWKYARIPQGSFNL